MHSTSRRTTHPQNITNINSAMHMADHTHGTHMFSQTRARTCARPKQNALQPCPTAMISSYSDHHPTTSGACEGVNEKQRPQDRTTPSPRTNTTDPRNEQQRPPKPIRLANSLLAQGVLDPKRSIHYTLHNYTAT